MKAALLILALTATGGAASTSATAPSHDARQPRRGGAQGFVP